MDSCKGVIHSLETFGSVDGPGVRFVVFLQGCKMRCKYCHNPETWSFESDDIYTPGELVEKVWKYRNYWGKNMEKGGVTVSGGEPLLQIEFVTEFFKILKERGVHTAIDTAGQPFSNDKDFLTKFDELLKYTDLVLLDLKQFDSKEHKALTGFDNSNILEMAKYLSDKGIAMWIRHVLVPGLTDSEEDLAKMAQFIKSLKTVERVEVLPYHTLGLFKWDNLNYKYPLEGVKSPTSEEMKKAEAILKL
ncbi:MAG: pyruvate formate lyase-activating protein [Clostridia bacterium]|nr:pyruvate formate lyase-activating protein [Clostridia bacterium]